MRKNLIKCLVVFLLACVFYFFRTDCIVHAQDISAVGHSINAITEDYLNCEYKAGSPVLDSTWLNSLDLLEDNYNSNFDISFYSSTSIEDYVNQSSKFDKFDVSFKNRFQNVNANIAARIKYYSKESYENYINKFYSGHYCYMEKNFKALPCYLTDRATYINHLDNNYISNLNRLNAGTLTYSNFFDLYGTHLIGKAVYGGRLEVYYSVVTNYVEISLEKEKEIETNFQITGLGSPNSSVAFNLQSFDWIKDKYGNLEGKEIFRAIGRGGNGLNVINKEGYSKAYSDWFSSINAKPSVIGFGSDGLIPLWELLPNNLMHLKPRMEQEFQNYANAYYSRIMKGFTNPTILKTGLANIRNTEFTIYDTGRYNQKFDLVDFCNWRMSLTEMKRYYSTVTIYIWLDVREVNDGYQYVCLYKDDIKSDSGFVTEQVFEFSSTSYIEKYIVFLNIPLSNFHNEYNAFYLRYSASGSFADTWKNKDLYIQLEFKK